MQKSLNSIGENKLRTIVGEWIKIKVEQSINYEKLFYISAAFTAVFLLLLHRSRSIKKTNSQLALLNKEIKEKNIALEQLARTDKLTALYNRVKLDETLISESNRANRFSHSFGVILIDIDYFKKVNDEFGHQIGDTVLQEFSRIIESNSRKTDVVGRWGGEEFLIISSEINLVDLLSLANKLRKEICSYKFVNNEYKTASFGISIYEKNENINKLIKRVDEALYKAKENGRNRVEIG
ncbi:GGDEF domain-containing protein [Vibrio sp. 2-Bac 85]